MILYWILFAIFSIFHLLICRIGNEKYRKASKVFIIPLLMLGLILNKTYNSLLFLGLFCGWIGDIFLIIPGKKAYFLYGTIAFVIGHFIYIFATLQRVIASDDVYFMNWVFYLLCSLGCVFFTYFAPKKIIPKIGKIAYVGSFYFYVLLTALLVSALAGYYVLSLGFLIFIISDATISISRFAHHFKRKHFYVMLTYILAQVLICLSFIYNV